jgi:hypothetical protein
MTSPRHPSPPDGLKVIRAGKIYTQKFPASTPVWSEYLEVIRKYGDDNTKLTAWKEARENARGREDGLVNIWLWGLQNVDNVNKGELYQVSYLSNFAVLSISNIDA